jgi:hypothetical protein
MISRSSRTAPVGIVDSVVRVGGLAGRLHAHLADRVDPVDFAAAVAALAVIGGQHIGEDGEVAAPGAGVAAGDVELFAAPPFDALVGEDLDRPLVAAQLAGLLRRCRHHGGEHQG